METVLVAIVIANLVTSIISTLVLRRQNGNSNGRLVGDAADRFADRIRKQIDRAVEQKQYKSTIPEWHEENYHGLNPFLANYYKQMGNMGGTDAERSRTPPGDIDRPDGRSGAPGMDGGPGMG